MTAEFRSNEAKIKNQLKEMQTKPEVLMMRVIVEEERVMSDVEDKLVARMEVRLKREKQKIMRKC